MYNSLSYNTGACRQIRVVDSLSITIQNRGYNLGPEIFKAMEAMGAKEKETSTKVIAKEKEAAMKAVKN